jgi:protein-disulfide isomerase/uncharacterized membrane protein
MAFFSFLTIRHFFAANYPESIFEGSICDINAFFNCDSSAFSVISQFAGVPLGYFGLVVGVLVCLGMLFPSAGFEQTNKAIALLNVIGVITLFLFSVFYLGSLCLLCSGYYLFSLASLLLFWKAEPSEYMLKLGSFLRPAFKYAATFAVMTLLGASGMALYHDAKRDAQSGGVAARVVEQFRSLPRVQLPSVVSPFMTASAGGKFEEAPIQVVEYADFLCSDCKYLSEQMEKLKIDFSGKLNIAFQFFPLDAQCNDVVEKDKHPGACDLSYMAAYNPAKFNEIHDEAFSSMRDARDPEWRLQLARKHGVEAALADEKTKELVRQIIQTGAEYEKTSDQYAHGIRSTPTMIVNNRMIIGTLPYEQLRAIFQSILDDSERDGKGEFLENWVEVP